jgi:branched-chain amino acid transport system ATP-binding protein
MINSFWTLISGNSLRRAGGELDTLLELVKIRAGYGGGLEVLRGVSLKVRKGEIVCLVGPNGAGKSTILRAISGIVRASEGSILFQEEGISGLPPHVILRKGVSHVAQGHSIFPQMTVLENVLLGAYVLDDAALVSKRLHRVYELFPLLEERKDILAANLSGGQQKILEIGRALMLDPPLMLLDEPSLGLAPKVSNQVFSKIKELNEAGLTVLMVEQNVRRGLGAAHRGYVLDLGEVRMKGTGTELLDDPNIARLYLGK